MKTIELAEDFYLFMFDPEEGGFEGLNVLALVEGKEALFFDTGYAPMMESALGFLKKLGARPAGAIVSHYHEDHAGGLSLLGAIDTWGSADCEATIALCFPAADRPGLEPTHRVSGHERVAFGRHAIELFPLPGHSPDSLGAVVDNAILYAADTLLFTNQGAPILPSVHARPVSLHAESLASLEAYLDLVFVPGHGAPVLDRAARARDLGNRIAYIEAIAARAGISLDEAQERCDPKFVGSAWHEENFA
jgi:glyoxylase-like metal-dependent hydrolase (beta-lactamase superfamily II)